MNATEIVALFFSIVAFVWGIWLVFRKDLLKDGKISTVVGYFIGVILTLIIVLLIGVHFLPWWTTHLIQDTRKSENVQTLATLGQDLWNEALNDTTTVSTAVPAPTQVPVVYPTQSPIANPTTQPGAVQQQSLGEVSHTVQRGDTLYSLGKRYGVTVNAIMQRNNLTDDKIQIGRVLIIPKP